MSHNPAHTLYYMVNTLTSGETGQASSSIDGAIHTLVKITEGDTIPTGTLVTELTQLEAKAAVGSLAFGATVPSDAWLACELVFCEYIANEFRKVQAALPAASAEVMFTEIEPTSHALSRGLVNISRARFQLVDTNIIDQPTIDAFTAIFDDYIAKLPRTLA